MPMNPEQIGQDRAEQDPAKAYDKAHGSYEEKPKSAPPAAVDMPKVEREKPYSISGNIGGAE